MSERNWQEDWERVERHRHAKTLFNDPSYMPTFKERTDETEILAYWLQEIKKLEAAIESLTEDTEVISMGEYQSLLNKHSTMSRAYHDAQEEIKSLREQLAHANCEWQREKSMRHSLAAEVGREKRRADQAEALLEAAEMLLRENDPDGIEKEVMSMARAQM